MATAGDGERSSMIVRMPVVLAVVAGTLAAGAGIGSAADSASQTQALSTVPTVLSDAESLAECGKRP